ncbi:recombinase-like helix-turn-helix domain-containing protein [Marinobacterium aestuariivivens]|uniref:Recombinase-like helix-turn-helix domain-containing protein n=1 Tax=Marinobacterium aestuariivivens TaxID=1698799 RepID=A0ABW2A4G1_9GAMM
MQSQEYNEKLAIWLRNEPCSDAGVNNLQVPGKTENIIWQTRAKVPSPYEKALADALEQVFADGAIGLGEVVAGLNTRGMKSEAGEAWTEASLEAELQRLGI